MGAMRQHDYNAAAQDFSECVTLSTTPDERVTALGSYGIALNRLNRNAEAKVALEQALALRGGASISSVLASVDRSLGELSGRGTGSAGGDRQCGRTRDFDGNLADLLREQARETEASVVLNGAGQLTGLAPQQQTDILVEQAELERDMHHWDASIALWNRIGEMAASEHSATLEAAFDGGLGETWLTAGNPARAEPLLRRSLQFLRSEPGVSPAQLATALSLMAQLYIHEDKLALAEEALDEAVAKDESNLGPGHPQGAILLELRADTLSRRGEAQPAREDLERTRNIMSGHFGPESTAVAGVEAEVGDVEERAKRPDAAVAQYRLAMTLLRNRGADSLKFGSAMQARYAAALKAAHMSGGPQSFQEK